MWLARKYRACWVPTRRIPYLMMLLGAAAASGSGAAERHWWLQTHPQTPFFPTYNLDLYQLVEANHDPCCFSSMRCSGLDQCLRMTRALGGLAASLTSVCRAVGQNASLLSLASREQSSIPSCLCPLGCPLSCVEVEPQDRSNCEITTWLLIRDPLCRPKYP